MHTKDVGVTGKVLQQNLSEIEELAGEILADREQAKNLDHRRNTNREALTALKKLQGSSETMKKSWVCFGGTFIKYPTENIKNVILKDQQELDHEIKITRDGLKKKVAQLHQLEGRQAPKGFDLNALDKEELSAFTVRKS